ncbi:MAG: sll0787 family AIR synthase-like protein [Verrucomicrobia bacterium]|nr:sll0787 family AIR synthase-like protein [Verrucomicrobiota bacterium]MBV8482752.1 sll0787 family AIR synthase-like protein [Verrucomicrobiota bacterium]
MNSDTTTLSHLSAFLSAQAAVGDKLAITRAYARAQPLAGAIKIGDDCAAIPDNGGFLLFAGEGMLESFVSNDPWFAGYSAVMVNLSDIAAMGGRPLAIIDILWTPGLEQAAAIWEGITAASQAYGVPVVGGHTTITRSGANFLGAAVLGRAQRLITSFDARPGDELLLAVDLRGKYQGNKPFWNASVAAPAERLRGDLALLPDLAEKGWVRAGKDISNGGIIGTLAMLLQCSRVGAELWLDRILSPDGADLARWLISFPSFGFLLSVDPSQVANVTAAFNDRQIACNRVGEITGSGTFVLVYGTARETFPVTV